MRTSTKRRLLGKQEPRAKTCWSAECQATYFVQKPETSLPTAASCQDSSSNTNHGHKAMFIDHQQTDSFEKRHTSSHHILASHMVIMLTNPL